jgi:pimeloyl-ACP methyl ester carboxylesterase
VDVREQPLSTVDWLAAELESIGGPIDLVGHDWGGGHVLNVAMTRPDLIRTWVSDVPGVFDPDYVWHDLAQQWQTAEVGEAAVTELAAMSATDRADLLAASGMEAGARAPGLRRHRRRDGAGDPGPLPVGGATHACEGGGESRSRRLQAWARAAADRGSLRRLRGAETASGHSQRRPHR